MLRFAALPVAWSFAVTNWSSSSSISSVIVSANRSFHRHREALRKLQNDRFRRERFGQPPTPANRVQASNAPRTFSASAAPIHTSSPFDPHATAASIPVPGFTPPDPMPLQVPVPLSGIDPLQAINPLQPTNPSLPDASDPLASTPVPAPEPSGAAPPALSLPLSENGIGSVAQNAVLPSQAVAAQEISTAALPPESASELAPSPLSTPAPETPAQPSAEWCPEAPAPLPEPELAKATPPQQPPAPLPAEHPVAESPTAAFACDPLPNVVVIPDDRLASTVHGLIAPNRRILPRTFRQVVRNLAA